ncbi:MAG: Protein TolB [Candidatus Anoxychlamydiales bacterium]|nr:Protein TolB [Candidatus Anoxychlamydiales bacterium]
MNNILLRFFLIALFLNANFLFAEELEVILPTNNNLLPIYVSKVFDEKANLQQPYLNEIRKILDFDLNFSGFSFSLKQNSEKDFKLSHFDNEIAFNLNFWKDKKTAFVVKTEVKDKRLKTFIFNIDRNNLKVLDDIYLSGNLTEDRKKLHLLSDIIIETLFGKKGISTLKILYTIRFKNKNNLMDKYTSEIYICDFDGANTMPISKSNNYFVHPVFIPEGDSNSKKFIFVSYITGQPKIQISSINNFNPSPLISLRGNQLLPSISIKKNKIAFISDAAGRPDLFMQLLDDNLSPKGKPLQLFSLPRATQASSSFSPDGSKLSFVSDKDGTPRIYIMNLPDTIYERKRPEARLITKKNRQNVTPSWSFDGKKIAYSAKSNGVRQIWIYDIQKDEEYQLTKDSLNKENPIWAPDSMHLVYNTEDKNESEVYIININQKKAYKITKGQGRKRFPYFEPKIN